MSVTTSGLLGDIAAFVAATAEPSSADKPVRLATVDPAYASGWPKVTFDGESTLSGKTYPHIDSYSPAKNDRVVLVPVGTTYLIIGAVSSTGAGLPPGSIVDFGGTVAPSGWLLCDGSAVSRTTYARLFTAIGTTWGAGNGSSTFNLPDFRGRVPVGAGTGTGLTARTVAGSGGAETVQLDTTTMPSHSHTFTGSTSTSNGDHGHSLSGSVGTGGGHSHSVGNQTTRSDILAGGGTTTASNGGGSTGTDSGHTHSLSGTASNAGAHTHTSAGSNASTGGGGAHENMPPWRAVNRIVKV